VRKFSAFILTLRKPTRHCRGVFGGFGGSPKPRTGLQRGQVSEYQTQQYLTRETCIDSTCRWTSVLSESDRAAFVLPTDALTHLATKLSRGETQPPDSNRPVEKSKPVSSRRGRFLPERVARAENGPDFGHGCLFRPTETRPRVSRS